MNNPKLILSLSCFVAVTLASPLATAAPRGGGGHFSGGHNFASGRPGLGRPGMGAWGGRNWNGRNWNGRNRSGGNWNGRNGYGNWHPDHSDNDLNLSGRFGLHFWA